MVKAFAWLVANKNVNTNDLFQLRGPNKALSLDHCVMCLKSIESANHIFHHYAPIKKIFHHYAIALV